MKFNKIKVGSEEYDTWATSNEVLSIKEEIISHVENPDTITAVASEIASGKKAIANAINDKGGTAIETESFLELSQEIQDLSTSKVSDIGIVISEPFSFLLYVCYKDFCPITLIDDNNIIKIEKSNTFYKCTLLLNVRMNALTAISGSENFHGCSSLQNVIMPNLTTIRGGYNFALCTSLRQVTLPNLTELSGYAPFALCTSLRQVTLPNLTELSGYASFSECTSLEIITMPNLTLISSNSLYGCSSLTDITFGTMILMSLGDSTYPNLRNITIGQNTNINLPLNCWTATNVIAEGQSGINELNSNLYNNLLIKLYDHSLDGRTRVLRIGWFEYVSQSNIAYATGKGWTLTT